MIETPAEVVRVENGKAWVRITERQGGCGRCDEPGGCRSMRIADAFGTPNQVFALPDPLGLYPGDRVRVAIAQGAPLRAALLSYGLGAVLMLLGAALGNGVDGMAADQGAALGALAGLVIAVSVNRILARSRRWRGGLGMTLVRDHTVCSHVGPS